MHNDYFAGIILMPENWVRKKWTEVKDINQMAAKSCRLAHQKGSYLQPAVGDWTFRQSVTQDAKHVELV